MENSRRDFLKKTTLLTLGAFTASSILNNAFASGNFADDVFIAGDDEKFTLPDLPYGYDALEPHIDKMTMEIHHSKHHAAYVKNLIAALATVDATTLGGPATFDNIFEKADKLPAAVRNNGGGHYNHSLFWTMMRPAPKDFANNPASANNPSGALADGINRSFGSLDEFKKQFSDAAAKRFGSGWAWLVKTKEGKLVVTSTANQDNPLMNLPSVEVKGTPILALDVWEHAYYLKNQNRRADYIASWWNVVNWETAENLFQAAK